MSEYNWCFRKWTKQQEEDEKKKKLITDRPTEKKTWAILSTEMKENKKAQQNFSNAYEKCV